MSFLRGFLKCALSFWIALDFAQAQGVKLQVNTPLKFHEENVTTSTKTVITGPKGTRRIYTDQTGSSRTLPMTTESSSRSDTQVQGASDPGIVVERKVYSPRDGMNKVVGHNSLIIGGPGSIHTESHSKTTTTPSLKVEVGK